MLAAALFLGGGGAAAQTLEAVRDRGLVNCGIVEGDAAQGNGPGQPGLDIEVCRAVAAAIFDDPGRIALFSASAAAAVEHLAEGELDLIARLAAGDPVARASRTVRFTVPLLIDGQGFMVPRPRGAANPTQLSGRRVCVAEAGEASAEEVGARLAAFATRRALAIDIAPFESLQDAAAAFFAGRCAALSAGRVALAGLRAAAGKPDGYEILPDLIAPDPTGPFVAAEDANWLDLVRWTLFALIEAEERGITAETAARRRDTSDDPALARFLGRSGSLGQQLGLSDDWVVRIVGRVGNYGEVYARHLGEQSPLKLERGPNALLSRGGLLQSMAFQ